MNNRNIRITIVLAALCTFLVAGGTASFAEDDVKPCTCHGTEACAKDGKGHGGDAAAKCDQACRDACAKAGAKDCAKACAKADGKGGCHGKAADGSCHGKMKS